MITKTPRDQTDGLTRSVATDRARYTTTSRGRIEYRSDAQDLHLVVDRELTVREGHRISHLLKDTLMASHPEIADVLIHVEPNDYQ